MIAVCTEGNEVMGVVNDGCITCQRSHTENIRLIVAMDDVVGGGELPKVSIAVNLDA